MKKIYSLVGALLFSVAAFGATFNLFTPATGILKGSASTYVTTPATSTDVKGLWTGTCDGTTYLRGDGSCQTPPGAGGGSVNSVSLTAPTVFSVTGSPVTSTGTLALTFAGGQTANQFLASPNGAAGAVALRAIVAADLPSLDLATKTTTTLTGLLKGTGSGAPSAYTGTSCTNQFPRSLNASGAATCSSVDATLDITGITPAANGGTANGFTAFTGPATTTKTFTLPNASATILTSAAAITVAQGGTGVATLTGIAKGNGTSAFTAAASGDVRGLWGGTCDATTYLRGDGSCQAPPTGGTSANPSATIGLTTVNGAAGTFMRSDAAPALSQAIAPTWTGLHAWDAATAATQFLRFKVAAVDRAYIGSDGGGAVSGGTGTGFGLHSATGRWYLASSGNVAMEGSTTGNVTINTPSSGQALTVSGQTTVNTGAAGTLQTWTTGSVSSTYTAGHTGSGSFTLGTAGAADLVFAPGAATRMTVGGSGNVSINAPTSGDALAVAGSIRSTAGGILSLPTLTAGSYSLQATGAAGAARSIFLAGQFGFSNGFTVGYDGTQMQYGFLNGNVSIGAPSSGTSLTVNATNASTAGIDLASGQLKIAGSTGTSGQVLTSGGSGAAPSWTSTAATILSGGSIASNGSGACSLTTNATVGLTSCAVSSTSITVTFSNAAPHFWVCSASNESSSNAYIVNTGRIGTTTATIQSFNLTSTGPITWSVVNPSTTAITYMITCQPV